MTKLNLSFKILIIYLMVFYPLIFQIYLDNSSISLINQFILFSILLLAILTYSNRIIGYLYSVKFNISIIFLLVFFYLTISLLLFFTLDNRINISSILREFLYSIIPILFYFIGKIFNKKEKNTFFKYLFYCLFLVIIIGLIYRLGLYLPNWLLNVFEQKPFRFNFSSYYTPIIMSFFAQLMFAIILFKKVKFKYRYLLLIVFFFISILTLQRAAFIGLIVSLSIYILYRFSIFKIILITSVFLFGITSLYKTISNNVSNDNESLIFSSKKFLEEIESFRFSKVQSDRKSQAIITNNSNVFCMLIGEGYGKYSPNNELALITMPDASYFRIFNELGLLGFFLFFTPFILLIFEAFKFKDPFVIYFIMFSLFAFYFNRVIWAIPINYIFYTSLGIFSNLNNHTDEK